MQVSWAARTDPGRHRSQNEDCYTASSALGLFVVADGMGGHAAGEIASCAPKLVSLTLKFRHAGGPFAQGEGDCSLRGTQPAHAQRLRRSGAEDPSAALCTLVYSIVVPSQ